MKMSLALYWVEMTVKMIGSRQVVCRSWKERLHYRIFNNVMTHFNYKHTINEFILCYN